MHDWEVSRAVVRALPQIPVFLAGGITAANVADAMRQVRPYGIDICTGIRTDGRLDGTKLRAVVSAIEVRDTEDAGIS